MDFSPKPTLTGERVVLRPFMADDAEAMLEILADPEVQRLTGSINSSSDPADLDLAELQAWYGSRNDQTDRLDLAVVDRASGRVVGEVVLNEVDTGSFSCNFRTLIGPDGRDRGLGSEAIALLLEYAFGTIGLHRIGLEVYDFNPRARHVYARLGFRHEGTRRDALLFDGEWVDAHVMAVLAGEWPPA
jgi:RimJ/RimL family protein N-acetyltransferase